MFLALAKGVFACLLVWSVRWFQEMKRFECKFECKIGIDRMLRSLIRFYSKIRLISVTSFFWIFNRKPFPQEHKKASSDQYKFPYIDWIRLQTPSIGPDPLRELLLLSFVRPQVYGWSLLIKQQWNIDRAQDGLWSDRFCNPLQQFVNFCFKIWINLSLPT